MAVWTLSAARRSVGSHGARSFYDDDTYQTLLARDRAAGIKHPLFGIMTADEHGWLTYKHLDHHLSQFGV